MTFWLIPQANPKSSPILSQSVKKFFFSVLAEDAIKAALADYKLKKNGNSATNPKESEKSI